MDLDLQGRIERFTLPEIFQLIATSRKSGTLGIQKDDSIVMVYFRQGEVIYGYGPRQTFHLGQLLKEQGVINEKQLEQAIGIQASTENTKRLGEIMISRGLIDRADLDRVVRQQVKELLYSLLGWETGSFKFYEDQFPTDEEITVRLSVENIILEGLRRIDEQNWLNETLPNLDECFTITASQGGRVRDIALQADEWNIMALIDGHRSLVEVLKLSPVGRDQSLKTLAHLKLAGLITKIDREPESTSPQLDKMINRLADLFEGYLTAKTSRTIANSQQRRVVTRALEEAD